MGFYQLVIFDLDGTLLDTAQDVHLCLNETLDEMNLPRINLDNAKRAIGPGPKDFLQYVLGNENAHRAQEFHERFRPIYYEKCTNSTVPFDGIPAVLKKLSHLKRVVATNKASRGTDRILKGTGIDFYFDFVITRDDVDNPKPAPDMLLHACEKFAVPPAQALMVGDTDNDILAAKSAGIKSCLALWGYSFHLNELKETADFSINYPHEILGIVNNER